MKITVFGTGYVGLVQAAVMAQAGHNVLCVDVDETKINRLKTGEIPIYEPGLEEIVKEVCAAGRLQFTTKAEDGACYGKIQFIAVGTPPNEDGSADLKYVLAVAESIARYMDGYRAIIDKSTVPVGTAHMVMNRVREVLAERTVNYPFDVISNPEFLKEGSAVNDCLRPDRILIGTDNMAVENLMREVYAPFNRNHDKMIFMDVRSAELTKYAANAFLATKISFINEIANLAERLGADIEKVRQGIGSDPRIGYHFIYPGCGYGGSCFPKDVQALIRTAEAVDYRLDILQSVENVNARQKRRLLELIDRYFNKNLHGKTFALWGLSFKPNTDDMREAPSVVLIRALLELGASVQGYDPEAMNECRSIFGNMSQLRTMRSKEDALVNADALIICTEWNEFRAPDFSLIKNSIRYPVIFDGRNLYDPDRMQEMGFIYYAIGRGATVSTYSQCQ